MNHTLLSVDLDWLNGEKEPIRKLAEVLSHVPEDTPTIMTVEHHKFLPQLRKWIKSGKVPTPFDIINIDEHHDYYYNKPPFDPYGHRINCGIWGYRLPLDWYKRYTWVHNHQPELCDWEFAESWFKNVGIPCSRRYRHRLNKLNGDIVAAVFCVSPDYLDYLMWDYIHEAVEMVVRHFRLKVAPLQIVSANISDVKGWRMAPRPLKVK